MRRYFWLLIGWVLLFIEASSPSLAQVNLPAIVKNIEPLIEYLY